MKKILIHTLVAVALTAGLSGCGDSFLDTKFYRGQDLSEGLTTVPVVSSALNGTYDNFYNYRFAGNYAIAIGDIPTDVTYWNGVTGHWSAIYGYTYLDTEGYLADIWEYGYKAINQSTRVIVGAQALYDKASDDEKKELDRDMAEAYTMRGYARLMLTNIFGHQIKVNGTDFSDRPGIVISDQVILPETQVARSTVGESYAAVVSDLKNALAHFKSGGSRTERVYWRIPAAHGILARAYLYMENWDEAITHARAALDSAKVTSLATTPAAYRALYAGEQSNNESFFSLAINATKNFGASSLGNVWSVYCFSPSPKLQRLYKESDSRRSIMTWGARNKPATPYYGGGKFNLAGSSPYFATNYIVNAPEMYLIQAEALLQKGDLDGSRKALLVVAGRDVSIKAVSDLPQTKDALYSFIKDERARELFQEGFRLWDLRRWDEQTEVYAISAPNEKYTYTNYKISDLVYPIPADEVNAGFGVTQTPGWSDALPKK